MERSISESKKLAGELFNWIWDLSYKDAVKIDPNFSNMKIKEENEFEYEY